jgi:hypothetical protein
MTGLYPICPACQEVRARLAASRPRSASFRPAGRAAVRIPSSQRRARRLRSCATRSGIFSFRRRALRRVISGGQAGVFVHTRPRPSGRGPGQIKVVQGLFSFADIGADGLARRRGVAELAQLVILDLKNQAEIPADGFQGPERGRSGTARIAPACSGSDRCTGLSCMCRDGGCRCGKGAGGSVRRRHPGSGRARRGRAPVRATPEGGI